jgi:hypothetical protein
MKQRLSKFLRWMFGLSFHQASPQELPSYDLEWTREDATRLKNFLATPAGVKLLQKGRAMEAAAAIAACKGANIPARVAGISDTFVWLLSLTTIASASLDKDATTEDSLRDNAETLAPELSYT